MIEIKDVNFAYSQGEEGGGLHDVNLAISDGEVVLLCGGSGCGKTTLTRLVNGLIPHFFEGRLEGDVLIDGKKINDMPLYETAKKVGSVFQNPRSQFFNVDTTSEIAFGCENQGLPENEIRSRMKTTVSRFGIEALMDRSIFELSGGEKQKIACASVSACEPEIFVLDEPTSNLDVHATAELRRMIAVWKKQGKTILIAEHRLYFLRDLADRIIYMKDGKVEKEFTQEEFKALGNKKLADMGLRPLSLGEIESNVLPPKQENGELTFADFKFSYKNGAPVLDIDKLCIPKGASVAVIGHNGAGKSTFSRCLCGLEKKCRGELHCNGKASGQKERLKNCYMVMQDVNHQLFTESVLDEVLLSMGTEDETQAEEILKGLDLLGLKALHPMALSGGQKQRVAIASAVASNRDIILFDEPTSGLDLKHMREVAANLLQLAAMGKTVIVVTHDPEFILSSCTHVVQMENGGLAANYPLDENGAARMLSFFNDAADKLEMAN